MTVAHDSALVLAHHARTFHLASRFLPADSRADAAVVYALCRLIDDTADEATDAAEAAEALGALKHELSEQTAPRPLVAAFHDLCARRRMSPRPALYLVDAVASDLGPVRVADDPSLLRYAWGVAGTVGLLMCGVLGVTDPRAQAHAVDLGIGMQLTNICRDVAEDADRGRVYLPADRLIRAGTSTDAVLQRQASGAAVATVVADLLDLADRYYASGEAGLRFIPARSRAAILVAARVYHGIGEALRARGADPLPGRVVVPTHRKVALVFRALLALPLLRLSPHDPALHVALAGLPGARPEVA